MPQGVAASEGSLGFRPTPVDALRLPAQRSAHEENGVRTCQMNTADVAAFPKASRVVRVGDAGWTSEDNGLLEKLTGVLRRRAKDLQPCSLEALIEPPPRVSYSDAHVYLLYGPRVVFVGENDELQVDIRGLVFEPVIRTSRKGNLVVNLGDDLPELPDSLRTLQQSPCNVFATRGRPRIVPGWVA